jgi:single-strand DNA-binding protein
MNETLITVVGHVATEPTLRTTAGGVRVAGFRLASTERRFDKGVGGWRDVHTTFYTVTSWRNMAENVCQSVAKGQPVVVTGRLRDSSYDAKDGQRRTVLEIEAVAVGHDLARGVAAFTKATGAPAVNVVRQFEEADLEEANGLGRVDPLTGELLGAALHDGFPTDGPDADDEFDDELADPPDAARGAA